MAMTGPILVTGVTGTMGNEVIRQLATKGLSVWAGTHTMIKGGAFIRK
jgi:nucleoside-diphosphate-sugar epimerase